jgi:hypothetical protein
MAGPGYGSPSGLAKARTTPGCRSHSSLEGDERRGLVAECRHEGGRGTLSLADVRFEQGSVAGWLHAAYRTWLGLPPFPARRPRNWTWSAT